MMPFGWRKYARATLPAIATLLVMLALWAYGRWGYRDALPLTPDAAEGPPIAMILGWLMALFVLAPTFLVLWIAAAPPLLFPLPRISLAYVLLADTGGLLLLLFLAPRPHAFPLAAVGALYLLLAAWLGLWASLAACLRRCGAAWSAVLPLLLASLCMAAPIVAMPLIRAAPASGVWSRQNLIPLATHACPMLAALDALQSPRLPIPPDWGTLPLMYRYSGLGQSIPAPLPHWWLSAVLYAAPALLLGACSRSHRPSPLVPESPDTPASLPAEPNEPMPQLNP
ncbi:MAG TPA: hypothetical protein VHQ47_04915 [Phycisphaerae bacterium]|nr:hypothetical protein [Phycisphaerae bacterium]